MSSPEVTSLDEPPPGLDQVLPTVVDHVALARLYGEPLFKLPQDLYIPPDALQVFLEAFEGPLDLLLLHQSRLTTNLIGTFSSMTLPNSHRLQMAKIHQRFDFPQG